MDNDRMTAAWVLIGGTVLLAGWYTSLEPWKKAEEAGGAKPTSDDGSSGPGPGSGGGTTPQALAERAYAQVVEEARRAGITFRVNSHVRDYATQKAWYEEWLAGKRKGPVAPPGTSLHEKGLAWDITVLKGSLANLVAIFKKYGFKWGGEWSTPEPWHFEYRGSPAPTGTSGITFAWGGPVLFGTS